MKRYRVLLVLMLWVAAAHPAHAALTVYPMRTSAGPQVAGQIRVYAQSGPTQFVHVSLRRIDHAAQPEESEVEVDVDEAAIAVTPSRFALAGGANRLIRLIPLQPVSREVAYRVYVEGVRGEEQPVDTTVPDDTMARLGVSVVWGALVNVLPADARVDARLDGNMLRNTGTLRMGITTIADCAGSTCTTHEIGHSLYPDSALTLPFVALPGHEIHVRYTLTRDGQREHMQTLLP